MSVEAQKKILKERRTKKEILLSELGNQYIKYESGKLAFGKSSCNITYPIIKALDLKMDDLEKIIE